MRRARWSRDLSTQRIAKVAELEQQLNWARQTYGDDDDLGDGSWRGSATSDVGDHPIDMTGFLLKRSGAFSGVKRRFFVLSGGTLLWYKNEADRSPTGYLHLHECSVITEHAMPTTPRTTRGSDSDAMKASCGFVLKSTKEYILWADDESERDKWLRALRHNRSFDPISSLSRANSAASSTAGPAASTDADSRSTAGESPDIRAEAKVVKRSLMSNVALRVEKKMVGRAVTSDIGKKLLREYCLPETFVMLQAMRELASVDPAMPPKSGQKVEDTILKMAVKVALLHQHGRLDVAEFHPIIRLVDELCIEVVRKYDVTRAAPHMDALDSDHMAYGDQMKALDHQLSVLLAGHITAKNISGLTEVLVYLGTPANLQRFLTLPQCAVQLGKVADSLRTMYRLD